ncbi:MAG: hypothetical protein KR126chlam5_01150 [Candidatus Anoxychlamydiales bacterium]|nr:hypothetical protein [Candidatus Anoxychlamydiales bacterium]
MSKRIIKGLIIFTICFSLVLGASSFFFNSNSTFGNISSNMNKTKIILFDIDGVLIRPPYYFSKELENLGYINVVESLNSFFNGRDHHLCLEGKADIEKIIIPFLNKFGWQRTSKDYLKQQFQFESNYLDGNFISIINRLRKEGIKCFLCTDQEKNRAKFILKKMNFQNIFDGHFISYYIGYRKCHDNFWKYVIDELKKEFSDTRLGEIAFFDDIQNNVDTASKFGIQAYLFKDIQQFRKDLNTLKLHKNKKPNFKLI